MHTPESVIADEIFTVAPAQPSDASGIANVRHRTWLATYPSPETGVTQNDIREKGLDSEDQVARWRKGIEDPSGTRKIWVAKNAAGDVVGYGQGKKGVVHHEIWGLYVLPEYQGKGLGGRLMGAVMAWLGDEQPVTLSVAAHVQGAIATYKKFGFVEMGTENATFGFSSGATIPSVTMVRPASAL